MGILTLTTIPKDFGSGGSGLTPNGSSLSPSLYMLLKEHKDSLTTLDTALTSIAQMLSKAVVASTTGASACSFPGAQIGDKVVQCLDLTGIVDANSYFETVITVANQIQQTAGFPGADLLVPVLLKR
jgi:hypothetical protein